MSRAGASKCAVRLTLAVCLAALCLLLAVGSLPERASAQEAPAGDVTFGELSATPNYPGAIDFRFTATSSEEIVRAELLFAPRWEETLNLIEADVTSGQELDVTFPLDMYANYLPPGLDVLYRWRLTDVEGQVSLSEEQMVLWADTRFAWTEIATDQVSVYFYTGNQGFNETILQSAQRTIDRLQTEFGVERSRPIRIWVYNSVEEFGGSLEPNSESWIRGAAYPGRFLILAVIPDGNEVEVARVIPHEVSHQVLFQATDNPFNHPALWLNEGLAVFNQESDKETYAETLEAAVNEGRLLPLPSITVAYPSDEDFRLAYAEGLSVVEFILDTWGEEALGQVIAAYREGVSHDEALRRGIGLTTAELDARWKESLNYPGDQPLDDGTGGATTGPASDSWTDDWWTGAAAAGVVVVVVAGVAATRRRRHRPAVYELLVA